MDSLYCSVLRITYQNEEDGFKILKVNAKGYNDIVTVVGYNSLVYVGSVLSLQGEWKTDKKYGGKQFQAEKWKVSLPATVKGMESYLSSGIIEGIGSAYAKKIVKTFGEDTLSVIENTPSRLIQVEGLGVKRAELIKRAWIDHKELKNIMLFLQDCQVSTIYATKIYRQYGDSSIETVKKNPYQLMDDIEGIGFKTADDIALKLGIDKESYIRCRAGVFYTLNELANRGHCYADMDLLVNTAVSLLGIEDVKIIMTIEDMRIQKEIISEDRITYYLPAFYFSEIGVAKIIKRIIAAPKIKMVKSININTGIQYNEVQKKSIKLASKFKFMVITGGAGTGKTTTINGIINMFQNNKFDILLAAPTGRAAKRMTEAIGIEAKTIHRLLEYKPSQGYQKNEENKLKGDILIIDETSMVDIVLMYNLLKAVPLHMSVILVGDVGQLPSVGAGNVFKDIIESGIMPVIKLEMIYRQAEDSNIVLNAHKINQGTFPDIKNGRIRDFFFIEGKDETIIASTIVDLCMNRLPKRYKINPVRDIQVLSPMRKGDIGTLHLNELLQKALNKNSLSLKRGGVEYRLNDKVMQIKNNYDLEWKTDSKKKGIGVFNGDEGIISNIDIKNKTITVTFDGNKKAIYDYNQLDELEPAYAITIHKSQGSEYPVVVIPISMSQQKILQRKLLYTGITRAKKLLILVGNKEALQYAVETDMVENRNTKLKERLMENVERCDK